MTLTELLKDSVYKLTQFSAKQIQELENKIIVKTALLIKDST